METLTYSLSRWSTEELIAEVVSRAAADGPALRLIEGIVLRARLAESDRRFSQPAFPATVETIPDGVRGTIEMVLAEAGVAAEPVTLDGHEVDAATAGAHAHDHTHRKLSSTKFAAHEHHHVHPDDEEADARLNGHSHARPHACLPWERGDSG